MHYLSETLNLIIFMSQILSLPIYLGGSERTENRVNIVLRKYMLKYM